MDSYFDPAMTLGPDDPLRAWADDNIDWRTAQLLKQDPRSAIDSMIKRGIAPPSDNAPVRDPSQGNLTDDLNTPPRTMKYTAEGEGLADIAGPGAQNNPLPGGVSVRRALGGFPQTDAKPAPPPSPVPATVTRPNPTPPPKTETSPLDPEENPSPVADGEVPIPKPNPNKMTDVSAKAKKADEAISDFSKSLQGVKALQPPPLNPVGTPSVRSPSAVTAPNIQNLMLQGQAARQNAILPLLGKLLVMGKA